MKEIMKKKVHSLICKKWKLLQELALLYKKFHIVLCLGLDIFLKGNNFFVFD